MVSEEIGCQAGILVAFADVNGPPLAIGVKLCPAVIAAYATVIPLRRGREARMVLLLTTAIFIRRPLGGRLIWG